MKKNNSRWIVLAAGIAAIASSCGRQDFSGRFSGTELVAQNGFSRNGTATLELAQNGSLVTGRYMGQDAAGTLTAQVNNNDGQITNVQLTVTSVNPAQPAPNPSVSPAPNMWPNGGMPGMPGTWGYSCPGSYGGNLNISRDAGTLTGVLTMTQAQAMTWCQGVSRNFNLRRDGEAQR
jgi:hypothetical protein